MNIDLRRKSTLFLVLVLFVCVFVAAGCGINADSADKAIEPADTEMQSYVHENSGMVFKLPADWQKSLEDDQKVIFINPEGTVALSGIFELGGYSYYTLQEQGALAKDICQNTLKDVKVLEEGIYKKSNNSYRIVMQGVDSQGNTAICAAVVYAPLYGVRYYLMTLAGVDEYKRYYKLFEESFSSFYVSIDEDTLYSKIEVNKSHLSAE
jgi:hypothetical protein